MAEADRCEECGAADAELTADGRWLCGDCSIGEPADALPLSVVGELGAPGPGGPAVRVGGEWWTWDELGEALSETQAAGRAVEVRLTGDGGVAEVGAAQAPPVAVVAQAEAPGGTGPLEPGPLERGPVVSGPVAFGPAGPGPEEAEAVALLADSLPPRARHPRPDDELAAACARIRVDLASGATLWSAIAAAAGWNATGPPESDEDLWLDAAFCLAATGRPATPLDPELDECLAAMELDDWLATIIELTRAGPGTPADPQSLLVLSARCMDVDSGAVDPGGAAVMTVALEVLVPVWRAVGAVAADGSLTRLGAWGLPLALARAWGGSLEPGDEGPDPAIAAGFESA